MKYEEYTAVDFIKDEYFIRWVKHPDEQSERFWRMWVAKHPEKREELMLARNMITDFGYKYNPKLTEDDYVEMFEGILKKSRQKRNYNPSILTKALKVAAVFAIILTSIFAVRQFQPIRDVPTPPVFITKNSPVGQKTITWLDDGTKVHLNSGSSIEYPKKFSDSLRAVTLKGEAFFEVIENADKPFIVKTGKIKTTVMGTEFNVRAYPDESKIDIAVVKGKVRVENENSLSTTFEHILTPNQMSSFDISSQLAEKQHFDQNEVLAWTRGIIYFNAANINEIIRTLERWYGVTFIVNRTLNPDKDFSISYENKPLVEILEGLSFAFDFEFEINEKIVTLN